MRPDGNDGTEYTQPNASFNVVFRGFDRTEVQRQLEHRDHTIRQVVGQRNAARSRADELARRLDAANSKINELAARVDQLCKPPLQAHDLSERLNHMLRLANAEAADIVAKAEKQAAGIRGDYERKIAQLETERKQQSDEHAKTMAGAKADADKTVAEAKTQADKAIASANAEAHKTVAEAKAEADKLITDARQTSTAMDNDARAKAANELAASKAKAQKLVAEATEEAHRRVTEARAEVERLRGLRGRISRQLSDALTAIGRSGALLEPLPAEIGDGAITSTPTADNSGHSATMTRNGGAQQQPATIVTNPAANSSANAGHPGPRPSH
ncbi:MAG: hypothetical protein J2O49_07895 [Sciscionella sp.]|nr:hypothetical protein [Sciscionella sp.]